MKPPTSPFQLGRMRHIELLELWHRLHPDSHERDIQLVAQMKPGYLAAAILNAPHP